MYFLIKRIKSLYTTKISSIKHPQVAIVVPCFNEGKNIEYVVETLSKIINDLIAKNLIAANSYIYFVDDGSEDDSWEKVKTKSLESLLVKGLKLSRNFGHQAALMAGLSSVVDNCDAVISIDADLQQDPLAIANFVEKFRTGSDIVLGVRRARNTDTWFKSNSAHFFYWVMKVLGVNTIQNHADYRLLSKRALKALLEFTEPAIFLRAMCLELGFKVDTVEFEVSERIYGDTKYSIGKMFTLALNGITSFSVSPLRIVTVVGLFIFLATIVMAFYALWIAIILRISTPGWASTVLPIYFIGGIQLLCLGIIGEYLGQIYSTVKKRPRWISEESIDN